MSFSKKQFEDFRQKKTQYTSSVDQTTSCNRRPLNARIVDGPCNQDEITRRRIEKSFQIRTVGSLQDEN